MSDTGLRRVKVLTGYAAHARWLAAHYVDVDLGFIPKPREIPSPYMFAAVRTVWAMADGTPVIVMETAHRRYEVFAIPYGDWYETEADAFAEYERQRTEATS